MLVRPCHSSARVAVLVIASITVLPTPPAHAETVLGYRLDVPARPQPPSVAGVEPGSVVRQLQPLVELADLWTERFEDVEELARYNASGQGPARVGLARPLTPMSFTIPEHGPEIEGTSRWRIVRTDDGVVWGTRLRVENAHALRLRIAARSLPSSSQVWLSPQPGSDGRIRPSGPHSTKRADEHGELLLPAVSGPDIGVEIHIPAHALPPGGAQIDLVEIVEVVDLASPAIRDLIEEYAQEQSGRGVIIPWESCAIDGTCITTGEVAAIEDLREAVARIRYQEGIYYYSCSATLIADNAHSGTPYLLTAEHCLSTQTAADGLTSYFDYRSATCNGPAPNLDDVPSVTGAELLVSGETSDVTLLQLDGLPTGQVFFMGWTTEDPTSGTIMHSLTHPASRPQRYAAYSLISPGDPSACGASPVDYWHFGALADGSTTSGSSGGGHIIDVDGGLLVGQHKGFCSPFPLDEIDKCDPSTFDAIIGAMSYDHPLLEPWLGPAFTTQVFDDGFESGNLTMWSAHVP